VEKGLDLRGISLENIPPLLRERGEVTVANRIEFYIRNVIQQHDYYLPFIPVLAFTLPFMLLTDLSFILPTRGWDSPPARES
jgi:hypothetical protein